MSPPDSERSLAAAKEATDAFTKEEKDPFTVKKESVKPGITFAAQDKLPKLPIPDLDSSGKKYLEALAPLQSSREHEETKAAVHYNSCRTLPSKVCSKV